MAAEWMRERKDKVTNNMNDIIKKKRAVNKSVLLISK
jgi:hypothetical protein